MGEGVKRYGVRPMELHEPDARCEGIIFADGEKSAPCQLVVLATDYDALKAENAMLREALYQARRAAQIGNDHGTHLIRLD